MKRIPVAAVLALLWLVHSAGAADKPLAGASMDSAFAAGFATIMQSAGFTEDDPGQSSVDWKPDLQLLVGVKAVEDSKRTVYFVQLTTLRPPPTNSVGRPWQPELRTNSWSPTDKGRFITTNYPVRVRVFDEAGRLLKEGRTPMAWGMLTNGLLDLCRLSFEAYGNPTNRTGSRSTPNAARDGVHGTGGGKPQDNEPLMRAMGGGLLWRIGMFGDLQTVPTVGDVWGTAQCAFRRPGLWTLAKSFISGFTLVLLPRPEQVTMVDTASVGQAGPLYCLPLDINSEGRNLTRVEIIVGPARGAEMLMAGIRTIRARHPTKPDQEFLSQVLATGSVREP